MLLYHSCTPAVDLTRQIILIPQQCKLCFSHAIQQNRKKIINPVHFWSRLFLYYLQQASPSWFPLLITIQLFFITPKFFLAARKKTTKAHVCYSVIWESALTGIKRKSLKSSFQVHIAASNTKWTQVPWREPKTSIIFFSLLLGYTDSYSDFFKYLLLEDTFPYKAFLRSFLPFSPCHSFPYVHSCYIDHAVLMLPACMQIASLYKKKNLRSADAEQNLKQQQNYCWEEI